MIRATSAALLAFLVALTGVVLWLGVAAHRVLAHLEGAAYNASLAAFNANETVAQANATLAALNAPCIDFQGDWICGPIPQLAQTEKNIGILAAKSAQQVQQSAKLVDTASKSLADTSQAVKGTADAATGLLASAQRATDQMPKTLETVDQTIAGFQPLLESSTRAVDHFDALVSSPDLAEALKHVQGVAGHADGIMADAHQVADKETADWLRPVPWWKQPIKKGGQLIDITAAISRHIP